MRRFLLVWVVFLATGTALYAQDPQFSQFYAAPLYLNPAFAGSTELSRVGLNFRSQWPAQETNFTTASVYFDHFFEDFNSGVGLIVNGDREGLAGLNSVSVGAQYAYQLAITDKLTFRPGFQATFYHRDVNFNKLIFGDQLSDRGPTGAPTGEQLNNGLTTSFFDISLGGLIYNEQFFFGYAAHHITEPNQSFLGEGEESRLPMKSSFHAGYKIMLPTGFRTYGYNQKGQERSITPVANYKMQGPFDQLDVGAYFTYEPVVFGLWYRGLPIKTLEGNSNNESIILLVGMIMNNLSVGYSFDYTISGLGIQSGGAHEISLSYLFSLRDPSIPPKNVRKIPCPKF